MTRKTHILISIIATSLLLAALASPPALAGDEGSTRGDVTVGNAAPVIDGVALACGDGSALLPADTLTPFQTATDTPGYRLTVSATDMNGLRDINEITVVTHYDADLDDDPADAAGGQDASTQTKIVWTPGGGFAIGPGAAWPGGGEWSLDTAGSLAPSLSGVTGEWTFHFQISKVARETDGSTSDWDFYVDVDDGTAHTTDNTSAVDYRMAAYRELSVSPGSVGFGADLTPGSTDHPGDSDISVNTIANGPHRLQIYASGTWGAGPQAALQTEGRPADKGSLIIWADAAETSANLSTANDPPTTQVTDTPTDLETNLPARETPAGGTVYSRLWLDLGPGIRAGIYNGTIYYRIQ